MLRIESIVTNVARQYEHRYRSKPRGVLVVTAAQTIVEQLKQIDIDELEEGARARMGTLLDCDSEADESVLIAQLTIQEARRQLQQ